MCSSDLPRRSRDSAPAIAWAEQIDTSCSPEQPPNNKPTRHFAMSALSPLARRMCDDFYCLGSSRNHHDSNATDSTSKYSYHVKGDLQTSPSRRSRHALERPRQKKAPSLIKRLRARQSGCIYHYSFRQSRDQSGKSGTGQLSTARVTNRSIAPDPRSCGNCRNMPQPISGFNTVTAQQRDRSGLCELSHTLPSCNFIARIDVIL